MKKRIFALLLAGSVLLGGCASLLERSYSMMEPYADRYWDSGEEDTLRVDSYQDLVSSLVMLVEQRAEEAVIRCYGEVSSYQQMLRARNEVRWETMKGAYLLDDLRFTFEEGSSFGTAIYQMAYREDAEDLGSVMTLTDSQSLVDLLRLAVREEHEKITAQFTFDTPREAVRTAVESYWQELCREEMEAENAAALLAGLETPDSGEDPDADPDADPDTDPDIDPDADPDAAPDIDPDAEPDTGPEDGPAEAAAQEPGQENEQDPGPEGEGLPVSGTQEEEPIVYPPCPWVIRFYPNQGTAELVEILLQKP